ncbi:MAG TPA: HD domain-containing protein [Candidatus Aenigmarchaeota archaeon]|nr:HD domain-containing protein [Candidatus Aenigmarchaeota archaeon]
MIITENKSIDQILINYRAVLKDDFQVYRNHVYRIYNYAIIFDEDKSNHEKYAIAAAFHDIGIWTHSFDYLEPSIKLASEYLTKTGKQDWTKEVALLIDNHHKISVYKGDFQPTVEVFRKSDWIDVIMGVKRFGLDTLKYKAIQQQIYNKGFHWFLIK